jgi:molybdopterin-containing oxidoreductase family iron-sulfur binding subunit
MSSINEEPRVTDSSPKNATPVKFWRSVAELKDGPLAKRKLMPPHLVQMGSLNRQQFLKAMGASLALAGLTGCATEPKGPTGIAPYVSRPPGVTEERSLFYASALTQQGYAQGVLVRAVSGRPIKVEGNSQHPDSLGATTIFGQAELLTFYDPDRSRSILSVGQNRTWGDFVNVLQNAVSAQKAKQGSGLRILTETITSPSLASMLGTLLGQLPSAKWHQWEPLNRDNAREGSQRAFGEVVNPIYHLDKADVIITLDSDLLNAGPGSLRHTRAYADKRRVSPSSANQSRLYAVESTPSVTGMIADHRLPVKARDVEAVGRAIAAGAGVSGVGGGTLPAGVPAAWVAAVVADLTQHRGTSLVVAGEHQSPDVHHLAYALNQALGNVGQTVEYVPPAEFNPTDQLGSLRQLVQDLNAGSVDLLVMLGGNPVYNAPADLGFAAALAKVSQSVHLSLHEDETSSASTWHVPLAHELESWGDARAIDGTTTIVQPTIEPLYGGKTPLEVVAVMAGQAATAHDLVKGFWQKNLKGADADLAWRTALHDGVIAGTALAPKQVTLKPLGAAAAPAGSGVELNFRPDPTIGDGRHANNGWLQELPKPLSQLTWDNVVYLSNATAQHLGVANGDEVEVRYKGGSVRGPGYIMAGHPDESVTLHLGYGRTHSGHVGTGIGYNAYALRTTGAPWFDGGAEVVKTGGKVDLATTQGTQDMEGRDIVLGGTLEEYRKDTGFLAKELPKSVGTLYPPFAYDGNRWGMSINLSSCIGCNACIVACQAENNIPVVGKEQVFRGRHMHWLRVDRYYEGPVENPVSYVQPVPCQQCENAPCELVCPVDATTHSDEGLNDMVYNRCIGTRYCSNNCPYKVRRFNFFQYADYTTPSLQLLYNPEVSVRERGVMEKCTYCVQRIRRVGIDAERENRPVRDGEIQTACQAACPARAIVFGNLNDPASEVVKLKADPLNYSLLGDLNTRPRTTYLGVIRNPNPAIQAT